MKNKLALICIFLVFVLICFQTVVLADEYKQIPGAIHVHSDFSSGTDSLEQILSKAKKAQIQTIILTDHDLVVMEYGLFPLRNLIKKRVERNSVLKNGAKNYLENIKKINNTQDDVIFIPGVQTSPFYYWTGSFFFGDLTSNDYRKEMLVIGMQNPSDYNNIPVMFGGFSTKYAVRLLPKFILSFIPFVLAIVLFLQEGKPIKFIAFIVLIISILFLINYSPFKSSPYDPYSGHQGIAPYQEVINYANKHNALVFWAHPEAKYAARGQDYGPIILKTKPYPEALLESRNYTGFSAIYGDSSIAERNGRYWDKVLIQYCKQERKKPVWAIAGSDYHMQGGSGEYIDSFQTVFLVKEKSQKSILDALAKGKYYALRKNKGVNNLCLDFFNVLSYKGKAIAGENIYIINYPIIEGKISIKGNDVQDEVNVMLIRDGKIIKEYKGKTPLYFNFEDKIKLNGKSFYRLIVNGKKSGRLLSNPIFVTKYF